LTTGKMNQPALIQNNAQAAHQMIQAARQAGWGAGPAAAGWRQALAPVVGTVGRGRSRGHVGKRLHWRSQGVISAGSGGRL
jgi:hypothetical protein